MQKAYIAMIRILCVILVGYIFLQGLFTLTNIQASTEKVFYIKNNPLTQFIGILFLIMLSVIITKTSVKDFLEKRGHIIFGILMILVCIFLIWWVTQTAFWYYADAEWMYWSALQLLDGVYVQWQPGGYAYMWPFQNGVILLLSLILKFFSVGQSFYIFPFLCIVFYAITVISIYLTLRLLWEDKALVNIQGIMTALYLPYAFLILCMFGDIIGYGWASLAVYQMVKYLKKGNRLKNLILSAIWISLAICFKPNCSILLVGLLILFLLNALQKRGELLRKGLSLSAFVLIVLIGVKLPNFGVEQLTGIKPSAGNSKWAHIAMGAQYDEEAGIAPGWYNDYNIQVFIRNDYDTAKTAKEAKADFGNSLQSFLQNPGYAWQFYNKKLAAEWNNPTMECFLFQNSRGTSIELSSLIKSAVNDGGKINILAIWCLDILQSALLFGIFMYFLHEKRGDYLQLFWGLLFIGAFVFWMFWETKSRYLAPYMLFLIPYAFPGYQIVIERFREKRVWGSLVILLGMVCFLQFSNADWVRNSFKIDQDTEDYYEYIHEYNQNFVNLRY